MTLRQRVLTILRGEKPDRLPLFGDLDYWATALTGRKEVPGNFKETGAYKSRVS